MLSTIHFRYIYACPKSDYRKHEMHSTSHTSNRVLSVGDILTKGREYTRALFTITGSGDEEIHKGNCVRKYNKNYSSQCKQEVTSKVDKHKTINLKLVLLS